MVETIAALKEKSYNKGSRKYCAGTLERQSGSDWSSSEEEQRGIYIGRDMLPEALSHIRQNMGFPPPEVPGTLNESLLKTFQCFLQVGLPGHPYTLDAILQE